MQYYSQSPIPGSDADAKAAEDSQYVNAGPPGERCDFTFVVDEQLNWVDAPGAVRVFSTRGKKCGLPKDPASAVGYCFWHNTDPDKFKATDYRTAIEQLVERRAYLGGAFLSGEAYATPFPPVDLAGAKLQGAYLSGAYMEGTCLTGANLNSAHLQGARSNNC